MSFATDLRKMCDRLGTAEAARACEVTPRSLQLWMSGAREPCRAMRVGVLAVLRAQKRTTLRGPQNAPRD
jgi:hypothetical protein